MSTRPSKCPNCKIDLGPKLRAVMPTEIPVKMNVEVCPQCGFEEYS